MEVLDNLEARKAMRLDPNEVLRPVEAKTVADIQRIVAEFDPKLNKTSNNVPISTLLNVSDDNTTFRVAVDTKSKSKRDILIEGLNIIKNQLDMNSKAIASQEAIEINGRYMKPAKLGCEVQGTSWVDPLIKQWFGGRRNGVAISWNLADGYLYSYDPYEHKLTRSIEEK